MIDIYDNDDKVKDYYFTSKNQKMLFDGFTIVYKPFEENDDEDDSQQSKNMKIVESGETYIFKKKAYFIHTKSDTGTYGETETISFILNSDTNGVFYYLNAGASQTSDLKKNMSILIQSLITFKIN